jgi:hypothetical protein
LTRTSVRPRRLRLGRATAAILTVLAWLVLGQLSVSDVAARRHSQGGTIVRCEPSTVSGTTDQTLTVDLYVQDVTGLFGIDLRTTFDPTIAQVVDEDTGPLAPGVQILPVGTFLHPDWVVRNVADNTLGTIRYAAAQVGRLDSATGSGSVARIRFTALQAGQFTMVFTNRELSNRNGVLIASTAQGCSITFGDPTAVALSGQNATRGIWGGLWPLAGLGVAAVAYGLLRRRRAA